MRRKVNLSLVLTLLLAVVLLFLAFRGVNWREMLITFQRADLFYLGLGCLISSISYLLRGLRWRVLLSAEKWIHPLTVIWANMTGYLGNLYLPARSGELIRSVMIGRRGQISSSFALATALTERLLDAATLALICLVFTPILGNLPGWLAPAIKGIGILSGIGLLAFIFAPKLDSLIRLVIFRLPLSIKIKNKLDQILSRFLWGMWAFQHPGRGLGFAGFTVLIWLLDAASTVIAARAFSLTLSLPQALVFLAVLGLSSAIPSTPGYVGIYQFVAVSVLPLFGFSRQEALAYIMAAQGLGYLIVTGWGMAGLWQLGSAISDVLKQSRYIDALSL